MLSGTQNTRQLLTTFHYWQARANGTLLSAPSRREIFNSTNSQCSPKAMPNLRTLLSPVRELFLAGGGGAGRTLPAAITEAANFGLDVRNLQMVCATSVGSILGLGLVMNLSPNQLHTMLKEMPAEQFQDWSWSSIMCFFKQWAFCKGEAMPNYFRNIIKKHTGLDDPTFEELYRKTGKEFRVIVMGVSQKKMEVLSHITTPYEKVADSVATSCGLPILYPPRWRKNTQGEWDLYVDGGLITGYPWGVGSAPDTPLAKQLGFIFINDCAAPTLHHKPMHQIKNFKHYLQHILTTLAFRSQLNMPEYVKSRTVAIAVDWNPLQFTATPLQQAQLNQSGVQGVRQFVKQMLKSEYGINVDVNDFERLNDINVKDSILTYRYKMYEKEPSSTQVALPTPSVSLVNKKMAKK